MVRDLNTVIRLRKWDVDEKRRALGQLLEREAQLLELRRHLDEEREAEAVAARQHAVEAGLTYGSYARRSFERREQIDGAIEQVRQLIAAQRDVLAEAFKGLKTFEVAQEARDEAERLERGRKEQAVLDEIGMTVHRRKQNEA